MVEHSKTKIEKEYVIPLRREFIKAPRYNRTSRAIRTIKEFIAQHMKVYDRDLSKIKLDVYFNNEMWFRGRKSPPGKVKVRAVKEGDIVKVDFVEVPEYVKFIKAKAGKNNKKSDKKEIKAEEKKEIKEEKTEEEKKDEKEKEKSVAEQHIKETEQQVKVQKHTTATKEPGYHRMALKK